MKKNLFEMGANIQEGWEADNKQKASFSMNEVIKKPQEHQLHFAKEKRRAKVVTIVKPFYLSKTDLTSLLKQIKKQLGTGGTHKDNTLEFQGEMQQQLRQILTTMHYSFK